MARSSHSEASGVILIQEGLEVFHRGEHRSRVLLPDGLDACFTLQVGIIHLAFLAFGFFKVVFIFFIVIVDALLARLPAVAWPILAVVVHIWIIAVIVIVVIVIVVVVIVFRHLVTLQVLVEELVLLILAFSLAALIGILLVCLLIEVFFLRTPLLLLLFLRFHDSGVLEVELEEPLVGRHLAPPGEALAVERHRRQALALLVLLVPVALPVCFGCVGELLQQLAHGKDLKRVASVVLEGLRTEQLGRTVCHEGVHMAGHRLQLPQGRVAGPSKPWLSGERVVALCLLFGFWLLFGLGAWGIVVDKVLLFGVSALFFWRWRQGRLHGVEQRLDLCAACLQELTERHQRCDSHRRLGVDAHLQKASTHGHASCKGDVGRNAPIQQEAGLPAMGAREQVELRNLLVKKPVEAVWRIPAGQAAEE
mmetsp:Transcript_91888/g.165903  ORF Transcript_91888/g.165903 Transcript_91888/m.165903 type:complete len:422 (-) Transcript_91888:1369-2634(-)